MKALREKCVSFIEISNYRLYHAYFISVALNFHSSENRQAHLLSPFLLLIQAARLMAVA